MKAHLLIAALAVLLSSSASANWIPLPADVEFSAEQFDIYVALMAEAERQDVPVEFVLANADVETMFRDVKNRFGTAHGPLQVHVGALFPHERRNLPDLVWNIRKGVAMLKELLVKSKGNTFVARAKFLCGPKYKLTCSSTTLERAQSRWKPAAARWGVPRRYDV